MALICWPGPSSWRLVLPSEISAFTRDSHCTAEMHPRASARAPFAVSKECGEREGKREGGRGVSRSRFLTFRAIGRLLSKLHFSLFTFLREEWSGLCWPPTYLHWLDELPHEELFDFGRAVREGSRGDVGVDGNPRLAQRHALQNLAQVVRGRLQKEYKRTHKRPVSIFSSFFSFECFVERSDFSLRRMVRDQRRGEAACIFYSPA